MMYLVLSITRYYWIFLNQLLCICPFANLRSFIINKKTCRDKDFSLKVRTEWYKLLTCHCPDLSMRTGIFVLCWWRNETPTLQSGLNLYILILASYSCFILYPSHNNLQGSCQALWFGDYTVRRRRARSPLPGLIYCS